MKSVFLDSVGVIALWNERDQWHDAATHAFAALEIERAPLVSTSYVIAECANALSRLPSRTNLARLVHGLRKTGALIFPTAAEWQVAWNEYVQGHSGSPGLVDHLSFAVMRRLGVTRVFTHDEHFSTAGFKPLF